MYIAFLLKIILKNVLVYRDTNAYLKIIEKVITSQNSTWTSLPRAISFSLARLFVCKNIHL